MRLAVLIGVVALAVAVLPVCAATEARPFTSHPPIFTKRANMTTNEWFVVHRFGFKAGGTIDMHVQVESTQPAPDEPAPANANASVYSLIMCSRHAFSKLQPMSELPIAVGQVYPTLCSPSVRRLCTSYDFQAHPGSKLAVLALVETVNFDEMYYFVFSTCGLRMNTAYSSRPPTAFVQLSFTLWNPGIGFISTTEAPFLSVYSYGALGFVIATVVWVVACLRTKAQGHCIILQLKMLVLPPMKAVALLVAYLQWAEKADGEPVGQWSTGMAPFAALTNVAYRAAFFECLIVLAKGWLITRRSITRAERRTMLCSVSVYAAAKLVFQLWGGALGSVALLSALVLTVAYVLLVYTVWHGARLNILETLAHIRMVRDHGVDPRLADVHVKYHMFRCLRNAFLMYLLSEAVTDVMARSPLFDEQYPWVPVLADEVVEMLLMVYIGYLFRPRAVGPRFYMLPGMPRDDGGRNAMDDRWLDARQSLAELTARVLARQVRVGRAAAAQHPDVLPLVVVNPDGSMALGKVLCSDASSGTDAAAAAGDATRTQPQVPPRLDLLVEHAARPRLAHYVDVWRLGRHGVSVRRLDRGGSWTVTNIHPSGSRERARMRRQRRRERQRRRSAARRASPGQGWQATTLSSGDDTSGSSDPTPAATSSAGAGAGAGAGADASDDGGQEGAGAMSQSMLSLRGVELVAMSPPNGSPLPRTSTSSNESPTRPRPSPLVIDGNGATVLDGRRGSAASVSPAGRQQPLPPHHDVLTPAGRTGSTLRLVRGHSQSSSSSGMSMANPVSAERGNTGRPLRVLEWLQTSSDDDSGASAGAATPAGAMRY